MAWQNQHMEPGILMGLRTREERMPPGERAFIMASNRKALEDGYLPVKVNSFEEKEEEGYVDF